MLELKSKNGDKMVESNDDIEFSERDLALIEALRKVKKKKRRKFILLLIFVTMIIGSVSIYVIEHPRELLFLKSENVTVELGNDVLVKPQDYLDKDKTDEDAYKKRLSVATLLPVYEESIKQNIGRIFAEPTVLSEETPEKIREYAENMQEICRNTPDNLA